MKRGNLKDKINKYFYDNKSFAIKICIEEMEQKIAGTRVKIVNIKRGIVDEKIRYSRKQIEQLTQKIKKTRKEIASTKGKIKRLRKKEKENKRVKKEKSFFTNKEILNFIRYGKNYWRH